MKKFVKIKKKSEGQPFKKKKTYMFNRIYEKSVLFKDEN